MSLLFWIGSFVISLAVLIKSADYFTESSEKIGIALKIPSFIVGVTIVSIGTSLPEFATSLVAVLKDEKEIVVANAVGSNIANILLVVGISSIVAKKMTIKRSLINLDLPLLACVTALIVFILWDKEVTFIEGIICVLTYIVYSLYLMFSGRERKILGNASAKNNNNSIPSARISLLKTIKNFSQNPPKFEKGVFLILILSSVFIYLGSDFTIESMSNIAEKLGISTSLIAMSAIAIGTSLPELAVSVGAAMKKKYEIALGNIFGSNVFNLMAVIGVPALITTIPVDSITFSIGIPFLIGVTVLYLISGISRKIYNWEGMMYLLIYILFLLKIFGIA